MYITNMYLLKIDHLSNHPTSHISWQEFFDAQVGPPLKVASQTKACAPVQFLGEVVPGTDSARQK